MIRILLVATFSIPMYGEIKRHQGLYNNRQFNKWALGENSLHIGYFFLLFYSIFLFFFLFWIRNVGTCI